MSKITLNESQEVNYIECPFCGYTKAFDNYEYGDNTWTFKKREYAGLEYCPLCGWKKYYSQIYPDAEVEPKQNRLLEAGKIVKLIEKISSEISFPNWDKDDDEFDYYISLIEPKTYQQFLTSFVKYIFTKLL